MTRPSRSTVLFPLLLAAALALGLLGGRYTARHRFDRLDAQLVEQLMQQRSGNKIEQTVSLLRTHYVDSLSLDSLAEVVVPLIVSELDPHSVYIPARDMQAVEEPLQGGFDGIGIVFNMATDTVIVLNVVPGGPSARAGIRAGDRIVRINDSLVAGRQVPQDQIMKQLRGKRGTQVRLSIERQGVVDLVEVEVTRDAIPLHSIESSFLLDDGIGYIRLSQFSRTTYDETVAALERLRGEGMRSLIFDLRGNPGGFLDQAIRVANLFLPEGCLIVYTEDRNHRQIKEYSTGIGSNDTLPVAVLIDEFSASSSEILAGALQDNDRGVIVGRRSYGKGLVQQQIPFDDGSALRLTVARYYTPTGRSIQKPYTAGDGEGYAHEIIDRYLHNEHFSADSIRFADSLRFTTPGGRTVYGGGGIMPDLFVPADTTDVSDYYIEVMGRNILYRYTIDYADRHRAALDRVVDRASLEAHFAGSDLVGDFVRYAARQGVAPVWPEIEQSRRLIEAQLRAYIARNTPLADEGFYRSIYPVDRVILRAIEALRTGEAPTLHPTAAPPADPTAGAATPNPEKTE